MDGYAGGIYYGFVEEYRRHVGVLQAEIADRERRRGLMQCPHDSEPTDAGVEDADRRRHARSNLIVSPALRG